MAGLDVVQSVAVWGIAWGLVRWVLCLPGIEGEGQVSPAREVLRYVRAAERREGVQGEAWLERVYGRLTPPQRRRWFGDE